MDDIDWESAQLITDLPANLAGDYVLEYGADVEPIGFQRYNRISLRPLIDELKVLTKERGTVRLGNVINFAQEQLVAEAERQLYEYGQIRIIILKARQMGQSTIVEAIIFSLSILYPDFQSLIVSHESESAEHILGMTKRYWTTYPFRRFHDEQYNGRKQLAWSDLGSNIVVATAKNVGAGRSKTLHALHASEVAMWDQPEELITGLRQAIPSIGLTAIFYESTAKGIGNFFHTTWQAAKMGRSEFVPMFFPWFFDPMYTARNIPRHSLAEYSQLKDPDEKERRLIAMGVTEGQLLWRRWAIVNLCQNDIEKFEQEYPATPEEAFLSTGRNVFPLNDLLAHYQPMKPKVGVLKRVGRDVRFFDDPKGSLKVYRSPSSDKSWGVYLVGADPTHTTVGDEACAQVINRRTLEQAAVLNAHLDPIEFGKQLFLLGEWYNMALIGPEAEGPGYATVGHLLGANYPFVWESQKMDKTPGKVSMDVFGWRTNSTTKHAAIGRLVNLICSPLVRIGETVYGLLIHDEDTFTEMKNYVTDEKGGFMNGDGSLFDDCVMALGIGCAIHFQEPPLPPYTRDESHLEVVKDIANKALPRIQAALQDREPDASEIETVPAWRLEIEEDQ
jgi:hypothetical protein